MKLRKSDGNTQNFDAGRLARSMERARVNPDVAQEIVKEIERMIRPGTSTQEIHRRVLHALESRDPVGAARYNLKHAMLDLGPSGYPFERYIGKLLEAYGWSTTVGIEVQGRCVRHEIDVYAKRDGDKDRAIEAKYRNSAGGRVDIKTALYVHARHQDLEAKNENIQGALVTNTHFTQRAIAYGECVGMNMKGWNYPKDDGLAKYIEQKELYPITVFSRVPKKTLRAMMRADIVLAHQVCHLDRDEAQRYHLTNEQLSSLRSLSRSLCPTD